MRGRKPKVDNVVPMRGEVSRAATTMLPGPRFVDADRLDRPWRRVSPRDRKVEAREEVGRKECALEPAKTGAKPFYASRAQLAGCASGGSASVTGSTRRSP
jgi:hypothetical protein